MSAEPKQTIGDQLRAFARRRRDAAGAPFEPHSVTRKLLQDEVARTFSARTIARKTTPRGWLTAFWVRVAFAGGLVALFILAAVVWLPKDSERKSEFTRKGDQAVPALPPASAPQPAAPVAGGGTAPSELAALKRYGLAPQQAPESNLSLRNLDSETARVTRPEQNQRADAENSPKLALEQDQSRVASATAAVPVLESKSITKASQTPIESAPISVDKVSKLEETPPNSALTAPDKVDADQVRKAKEVALASASASRSEERPSFAVQVAATNVFYFSQAADRARYRRNFNSPPLPPVLRSFQVQQSGANIRFIDADGSVYEGVVKQPVPVRVKGVNQLADQRKGNLERKLEQPLMQSPAPATARSAGTVTFHAVGTNQSVNKLVVISGELQPDTNQTAAAASVTAIQAVTLRAKASIGRNTEIPIEASGTTR